MIYIRLIIIYSFLLLVITTTQSQRLFRRNLAINRATKFIKTLTTQSDHISKLKHADHTILSGVTASISKATVTAGKLKNVITLIQNNWKSLKPADILEFVKILKKPENKKVVQELIKDDNIRKVVDAAMTFVVKRKLMTAAAVGGTASLGVAGAGAGVIALDDEDDEDENARVAAKEKRTRSAANQDDSEYDDQENFDPFLSDEFLTRQSAKKPRISKV